MRKLVLARNELRGVTPLLLSLSFNQHLTHLDLSGQALLFPAAVSLAGLRGLETLDVGEGSLGDQSAANLIASLADCPSLTCVRMVAVGCGRLSCMALAHSLAANKALREFYLDRNQDIGDEGAGLVARGLAENHTLRIFSLGRCEIGYDGLAAISLNIRMCRSLLSLNVAENRFDIAGLASRNMMVDPRLVLLLKQTDDASPYDELFAAAGKRSRFGDI